jgi:IS5 family transposase
MLTKTIEAGRRSGAVEDASLDEVAVDTAVMEKNIAYPTDSPLHERARAQLVDLAQLDGVELL